MIKIIFHNRISKFIETIYYIHYKKKYYLRHIFETKELQNVCWHAKICRVLDVANICDTFKKCVTNFATRNEKAANLITIHESRWDNICNLICNDMWHRFCNTFRVLQLCKIFCNTFKLSQFMSQIDYLCDFKLWHGLQLFATVLGTFFTSMF